MEENKALAIVDNKVIEDFIFSTGTILTPQHKKLFIALAVHNQLDPFKREIHAIPYKDKEGRATLSVVTGYEVYLKRAERSNKLDGWKVWTEGQGDALKAIVEIRRKDWKEPLRHEVIFKEYNLGRSLWISKPVTMIKKVAIAQGFRLAFPEELGGIPYTADEIDTEPIKIELPIEDAPSIVTPEPEKPEPPKPDYKFLKSMELAKKELGKELYYEVLYKYEFTHANEIEDSNVRIEVLKDMREAFKRI